MAQYRHMCTTVVAFVIASLMICQGELELSSTSVNTSERRRWHQILLQLQTTNNPADDFDRVSAVGTRPSMHAHALNNLLQPRQACAAP
jgi:hypothetical protein